MSSIPLSPPQLEDFIEIHPTAALFPMLDEDDLQSLADNIREIGQLHPIALDAQGRILDGRSRLRACELAGVEPEFTTYDGTCSPSLFALSVNVHRRSLTKGQIAMIYVKACSETDPAARSDSEHSARSVSEQAGVSVGRIGQAQTVLRHASHLVDPVISGATGLDEAYKVAREQKAAADSVEAQLARLRAEDPELADKVVEGELTLAGAWAERRARVEEEVRQRRVATRFVCEIVPALADSRGTGMFAKFDPDLVLPGTEVTRATIAHAMEALTEMAQVWQERDLP